MQTLAQKHSKLFRIVTTVVFSLLLFNTATLNYPIQDDPISQLLNTLEYLFFGTTSAISSTASSAPSDSTMVTGIDPSYNPPPPPPPK